MGSTLIMLIGDSYFIKGYSFVLFCLLLAASLPVGFSANDAMSTLYVYAVLWTSLITPVMVSSGL